MATVSLAPRLSPRGHLQLAPDPDAPPLASDVAARLEAAFTRGAGHGLLALGGAVGEAMPPALAFFRGIGARYLTAVRSVPDAGSLRALPPLDPPADLDRLGDAAPPFVGAEYLSAAAVRALWSELDGAFGEELATSGETLGAFLHRLNPAWNLVGRVHFHLAENRKDEGAPFAFLATYTPELAASGRARHLPLGQALREYAGATNRDRLLSLLLPVQRAAERCAWLKGLVDRGELFHPLRWSPPEAFRLLQDVPALEEAGVVVRMPAGWVAGRPPRPMAQATVGTRPPSALGKDALLDFRVEVSLDGEPLTRKELEALLAGTDGLALLRGRWVEVDRERLSSMLERLRAVERIAPGLRVVIAHASARVHPAAGDWAGADLVVTSYGALLRNGTFAKTAWNLVVLDEAQAVKNPGAKQTRAVKGLEARARVALTGTPVENRLSDLWSIFDFLNPGPLGSAKAFTTFTKMLAERPDGYRPLRELIRPYLLRRLKTDPTAISDLPKKTEVKAYCPLAKKQAALYAQAADDLAAALDDASGIKRKGVVLAATTSTGRCIRRLEGADGARAYSVGGVAVLT